MRLFDTMFARTAWLILAVIVALSALLYFVQRNTAVLPAVRTSAITLAELIERDDTLRDEARPQGPPPAGWRDRILATSPVWRAFAFELREQLGPDAKLQIRSEEAGPVIWAHLPGVDGWIARQMDLPRSELRGSFLLTVMAVIGAIVLGAALLARQLTGPLRRLAGMADRFAAGEPPGHVPVGGPVEIRNVQQAFVRLSQSLQAAEQEREGLLAGVSHDLRTPIGRMRLALSLYGEGANAQLVEELEHDLDELEQVASQFVAYARSNFEEPVSSAVLDEVVGAVVAAVGRAEVRWQGGARRPLPLEVRNVRRVVENLLDNAVRHGKSPIEVCTTQTENEAALIVRDAGIGILAERQSAALQPFVRFAPSDCPGSGLGLAIVDRIARRHGGKVSMSTTPGGFEVRVTFAAAIRGSG